MCHLRHDVSVIPVVVPILVCVRRALCIVTNQTHQKSPLGWIKCELGQLRTVLPAFDPGPSEFPVTLVATCHRNPTEPHRGMHALVGGATER